MAVLVLQNNAASFPRRTINVSMIALELQEEEGTRPKKKAKVLSSKNEISNPDTMASNIVAEHMVNALAGFQFSLSTKAAIKSAAVIFLYMARRFNLNVPEDDKEARRSIGKLIVSTRRMDLSSLKFCSMMCQLFGANKSGAAKTVPQS